MSEWKPWFGGEQPVPDNVWVDYLMRANTDIEQACRLRARDLVWGWFGTNGDVIHYRVVDDEPPMSADIATCMRCGHKKVPGETCPTCEQMGVDFSIPDRPTEPHSADVVVTHARAPVERIETHSASVELVKDGPNEIGLTIGNRMFTLTSISDITIEEQWED